MCATPEHSVSIATDSAVALPASVVQEHGISVAKMEITIGDATYQDGSELDASDIYEHLATEPEARVSVSAPTPQQWLDAITEAVEAGAGAVLCITVSARLSASYDSARVAMALAKDEALQVELSALDSNTAGGAQALIVLEAARQAKSSNLQSVIRSAKNVKRKVRLAGALNTLEHIHHSGRVPKSAVWTAQRLNLKPIIAYDSQGMRLLAKRFTRRSAINRIIREVERDLYEKAPQSHISVMHANSPEQAEYMKSELLKKVSHRPQELITTHLHPFMGVHAGPGAVAAAWWS